MMAISAQQTKIHVAIATWEWGSYFDPKLKIEGIKLNVSRLVLTRFVAGTCKLDGRD